MVCEKKTECCGCTSCANACPTRCISMKEDFEGFLYPDIDEVKCIGCGLCEKVCPVLNTPKVSDMEIKAYAVRVNEEKTLKESTSGGFITPLANWVFAQNGVLCAASYLEDFSVSHIIVESNDAESAMPRIRGSKYVQSDLGDCYAKIQRLLIDQRLVCFVGTTCQVNGLKAFLRTDYDNLITVDLVCHGTPSPKLWRKYLSEKQNEYGARIVSVAFRNKTYGYHSHTMKIEFENGRTYHGSGRIDAMMKSFMCEIASRPICYECPFKTLNRCSDFTVFDCWHADKVAAGLKDDDKGYTSLFIQSAAGVKLFEQIMPQYIVHPINSTEAIKYDGKMLLKSAIPHRRRDVYYVDIDNEELKEHVQKFIPISMKDYLVEGSKSLFYKIGILGLVRRIVK